VTCNGLASDSPDPLLSLPMLCRFSDAGMTRLSTHRGDRRPKSAKARNRGKWGHRWCRGHSANQFLKAATNLNFVQPKLFQASRQDDLRFSYCRVSVIQFLTMQMQPSASCARMWTVLSATIMFADKPHRLNERTSAQRFCVLTILPPVPHSRLGYPRSGLSRSDFVHWHL
jgi:hypothetical protein